MGTHPKKLKHKEKSDEASQAQKRKTLIFH